MMATCFCIGVFAQKTIRGTVKDASDNMYPLPGVSIQVKGTSAGTVTDIDGKYSITVQPNDKDLVFSFIGMETQTIAIKDRTEIDVVMDIDSKMLGEVVVSALGIKRDAKSLSVAQQRVDTETLAEVRDQNIVSSLSGKIAGVQVTPPGSTTGSARIVIRGNSSFTGNNQPLFVVDGMIMDNYDGSTGAHAQGNGIDLGNGAADINADDIESMDVLKGPNAAALYGSRAANGVILITTKKAKEGRFKVSLGSNTQFHYVSQWPEYENAFGVGHVLNMIGGNRQYLVTHDENGNPYPYPGIPSMKNMTVGGARSTGGPHLGQTYIGLDGVMRTYSPQPDNVYDFYRTGRMLTNNVAIEGGNIDNNYRISFTNTNADDVIEKQNLVNKNNVTLRFFNTLVKNITLDSKVTYMSDVTKNRRYTNGGSFNPTSMYIYMPRSLSLDELKNYKDENGNELANLGDAHNPYWSINETKNKDTRNRVMGSFDLAYQILPSLRFSLRYGKDFLHSNRYEFRNKGATGSEEAARGYYGEWTNKTDNNTYEFLTTFNERFSDFSVVASFGGSRYDYSWYNNSAQIRSLKQAGFAHITNSDDYPETNEDTGKKRINSLYGQVSLGYKDFAYLDLTARNDWSSTLPKDNNSYFYPSIGVSLIPSDMLGIPSRTFFGKVRASFAQVGNDTDPYRIKTYYNLDANNIFNGYKYASLLRTLPNADLKPEITTSYEVGADLRFLNGRFNIDFTYYNQESKDQIIEAQMAPSSGYERRMYNAGKIRNDGIELQVQLIPIETSEFTWEFLANFTKNNSKVLSMIEGVDEISLGGNRGMSNVLKVGYPYGVLKGTNWLTDNDGRRMVQSGNGEPVPLQNQYYNDVNPDWMLGISNRFRYKSFDLYFLIDIKKGGHLFSASRGQGERNSVFAGDEQAREDYWFRTLIMGDGGYPNLWGGAYMDDIYYYEPERYDENMNTYKVEMVNGILQKVLDANGNPIPDPDYVPEKCERFFLPQNVGYYSDTYGNLAAYDASYVKLRELSVGYNLPKKLIAKAKMTNARISLVGRNLWILHQNTPKGLDPESSINAGNAQGLEYGALPPTTTLGFDIKISF